MRRARARTKWIACSALLAALVPCGAGSRAENVPAEGATAASPTPPREWITLTPRPPAWVAAAPSRATEPTRAAPLERDDTAPSSAPVDASESAAVAEGPLDALGVDLVRGPRVRAGNVFDVRVALDLRVELSWRASPGVGVALGCELSSGAAPAALARTLGLAADARAPRVEHGPWLGARIEF